MSGAVLVRWPSGRFLASVQTPYDLGVLGEWIRDRARRSGSVEAVSEGRRWRFEQARIAAACATCGRPASRAGVPCASAPTRTCLSCIVDGTRDGTRAGEHRTAEAERSGTTWPSRA